MQSKFTLFYKLSTVTELQLFLNSELYVLSKHYFYYLERKMKACNKLCCHYESSVNGEFATTLLVRSWVRVPLYDFFF